MPMTGGKERLLKMWAAQQFDERLLDYSVVEQHKQMLEGLATVGSTDSYIYDAHKQKYLYLSQNHNDMFPCYRELIDGQQIEVTAAAVHPNDYEPYYEMRAHFYDHLTSLPVSEQKDYMLILRRRIRSKRGEWMPFVTRQKVLELDSLGNIWLIMGMIDLAPDRNPNHGFEGCVLNYKTGERLLMADFTGDGAARLTKREQEILQLVKGGLLSKEISDKLSISVNTVNIHRQNILQKTNTGNAMEAVRFAEKAGLI